MCPPPACTRTPPTTTGPCGARPTSTSRRPTTRPPAAPTSPSELADDLAPLLVDPSWASRQYDHQLFLNTVVGPGGRRRRATPFPRPACPRAGPRGMALSTDGNPRWCALDPRPARRLVVAESALNVACAGAVPVALVNCLNFGNPEHPEVMWQLSEAIDGMAEACTALGIPVVGGNVSLYNESKGTDIDPTPVVGMLGLIDHLRPGSPPRLCRGQPGAAAGADGGRRDVAGRRGGRLSAAATAAAAWPSLDLALHAATAGLWWRRWWTSAACDGDPRRFRRWARGGVGGDDGEKWDRLPGRRDSRSRRAFREARPGAGERAPRRSGRGAGEVGGGRVPVHRAGAGGGDSPGRRGLLELSLREALRLARRPSRRSPSADRPGGSGRRLASVRSLANRTASRMERPGGRRVRAQSPLMRWASRAMAEAMAAVSGCTSGARAARRAGGAAPHGSRGHRGRVWLPRARGW